MDIQRHIAHAPRTQDLGRGVAALTQPCVGCTDCRGLCQTLIELMTLPEVIVDRRAV
ncbi:hypothetical protein P1J78_03810 [Psychromarinibacter sp. C21-152]|uniref:Uncharacterized protein n=1 Tax=Psychromarinibacter sediminicola TaxID=3033385 RepID=A0AAE3NSP9_9RHOB|nr:hypothetical protein [Psychromarinibacter sediminicola]MDF0599852.1 hypothetical protein [Psychromarinibacter sediminicola]